MSMQEAVDNAIRKLDLLGCTDKIHNSFSIAYDVNKSKRKKLLLYSNKEDKLVEADINFDTVRMTTYFTAVGNMQVNGLIKPAGLFTSGQLNNKMPDDTFRIALGYGIFEYNDEFSNKKKIIICQSKDFITLINYRGRSYKYDIQGYPKDGDYSLQRLKETNVILITTAKPIYNRSSILMTDEELDKVTVIRNAQALNDFIHERIKQRKVLSAR